MPRAIASLLTVLLVLASLVSTVHALPHGGVDVTGHSNDHAEVAANIAGAAASCCEVDGSRITTPCPSLVAVLPAASCAQLHSVETLVFAVPDVVGDGLHPRQILDPPRS